MDSIILSLASASNLSLLARGKGKKMLSMALLTALTGRSNAALMTIETISTPAAVPVTKVCSFFLTI